MMSENQLRILYLHQYFVPPDGCGGTRSYELARRLVSAGHAVTLITGGAFFPAHYRLAQGVTRMIIDGIDLRVVKVDYSNRMSYAQRIRAFMDFAWKATMCAVKEQSVDVVFATSTPLTIALPGLVAKAYHRRPMVFEVRDLWPQLPIAVGVLRNPLAIRIAYALERAAYRWSERIVALSPGMKDGVAGVGYPGDRVEVIPNLCNLALFGGVAPEDGAVFVDNLIGPGGPVVTYAGTLGTINRVDYLLEVAKHTLVRDPDVRFLIAGEGRERERLIALAEHLGVLGRNVTIVGPVPKTDMPKLLAGSAVATSLFDDVPAMQNNSANKFFDAIAAGRPMMINYGGWQAELLIRTGAGIVVPQNNARRGAQLLQQLVRDPERSRRAGLAARRLAEEFSADCAAERLAWVLAEAARRVNEPMIRAAQATPARPVEGSPGRRLGERLGEAQELSPETGR